MGGTYKQQVPSTLQPYYPLSLIIIRTVMNRGMGSFMISWFFPGRGPQTAFPLLNTLPCTSHTYFFSWELRSSVILGYLSSSWMEVSWRRHGQKQSGGSKNKQLWSFSLNRRHVRRLWSEFNSELYPYSIIISSIKTHSEFLEFKIGIGEWAQGRFVVTG